MHIARFGLTISLFLFTLFSTPLVVSAVSGGECRDNEYACHVYEVCNDRHYCQLIVCDANDDYCNNNASEQGGELIEWAFDDHQDHHDWAQYEENKLIVRLNLEQSDDSLHNLINKIERDYDLQFVKKIYRENGIILFTTTEDGWNAAEALQTDSRVIYAEPNVVGDPPQASKGQFIWLWGDESTNGTADPEYVHTLLQLDEVHNLSTGADMTVAVIDTGIDHAHPWFQNILVDGQDFIDDDHWPQEELGGFELSDESMHGHGTHVAGIITQIAPDAKIMPLRALDSSGVGSIFPVAEAILHAAEHCADVINLSMGTSYQSYLLTDVIEIVTEADSPIRDSCEGRPLTVVAAVGNRETNTPYYPAAYDSVIAVTSSNPDNSFAQGANYGDWVTLSAPGVDIYSSVAYGINTQEIITEIQSCFVNDKNLIECTLFEDRMTNACIFGQGAYQEWSSEWYMGMCDYWSGTSMAAPFVAGSAALIGSVTDSADIRPFLVNTATPLTGDEETAALAGNGVVSPLNALNTVETISPSQPPLQVSVSEVGLTAAVDGIALVLLTTFALMIVTYGVNFWYRPYSIR